MKTPTKQQLITGVVLGVIIILVLVIAQNKQSQAKNVYPKPAFQKANPFPGVNLQAKAAIVVDVNTGQILFGKNETTQLPLASITKVMTALVAKDLLPDTTTLIINQEALAEDGDNGLRASEHWQLKDLIDFTLVSSSNNGAKAISQLVAGAAGTDFISLMNREAAYLKLNQTYFINATGLDIAGLNGGSYGSAEDMAKLFSYVLTNRPDIFTKTNQSEITVTSLNQITHIVKNTNPITTKIPGLIGSKTGLTDIANGNLAIIFDRGLNQPTAIVVLGSTEDGRFTDVQNLVNATLSYFSQPR